MPLVKLTENNTLEYFKQPSHILGDATNYGLEQGYLPLIDTVPDGTGMLPTQKFEQHCYEENGTIVRAYLIVDKTEEEIAQDRIDSIPEQISKLGFVLGLYNLHSIAPEDLISAIDSIEDFTERKRLELEWEYSTSIKIDGNIVELMLNKLPISRNQMEDLFVVMRDV